MSYQSIANLRLDKSYRPETIAAMKDRLAKLDPVRRLIVQRAAEVGTDLKALSGALGKNVSYLHTFVTKGSPRKLDGDDRKRLADLLEIPETALKPGGTQVAEALAPSIETIRGVEYARIPTHDIRAAGGLGVAVDDSDPIGWRLFESSWLKTITPSKLPSLRVIQVAGDSMTDTLANGDHILVDLAQRTLAREGIFVLRLDGELIVKRVQKSFSDGSVTIRSDNARYAPEVISDPDRLDVVGRVVWLARSIG